MSAPTVSRKIFTTKCKAYRKFVEKVGDIMDLTLDESVPEVKFININTQYGWVCFLSGWMSHPHYNDGWVTILAKVDPDGFVTVAERPHVHITSNTVVKEKERLGKKHGMRFVEFRCFDAETVSSIRGTLRCRQQKLQEIKETFKETFNENQVQV